jgi:hypothetical protein
MSDDRELYEVCLKEAKHWQMAAQALRRQRVPDARALWNCEALGEFWMNRARGWREKAGWPA